MSVNSWVAIGPSMLTAYQQRVEQGELYSGPMDDTTFGILNSMSDVDTVQGMFKTKPVGSPVFPFTLFTMNFQSEQEAVDALGYLAVQWPGQQFEVNGVWHFDGRQLGTEWDVNGSYDPEQPESVANFPYVLTTTPQSELIPDPAKMRRGGQVKFDGTRYWYTTTDTPTYPIPSDAWKLMPPERVGYDENGDPIYQDATSNADLRNINQDSGQSPRRFA